MGSGEGEQWVDLCARVFGVVAVGLEGSLGEVNSLTWQSHGVVRERQIVERHCIPSLVVVLLCQLEGLLEAPDGPVEFALPQMHHAEGIGRTQRSCAVACCGVVLQSLV